VRATAIPATNHLNAAPNLTDLRSMSSPAASASP
jgi:hypothetical protein